MKLSDSGRIVDIFFLALTTMHVVNFVCFFHIPTSHHCVGFVLERLWVLKSRVSWCPLLRPKITKKKVPDHLLLFSSLSLSLHCWFVEVRRKRPSGVLFLETSFPSFPTESFRVIADLCSESVRLNLFLGIFFSSLFHSYWLPRLGSILDLYIDESLFA